MAAAQVSRKAANDHMEKIQDVALSQALTWGIGASAVVGGLTYLATKRFVKFDKYLSVSAKTSFPVMAGLGFFHWRYELVAHDAQSFPTKWGLPELVNQDVVVKKYTISKLPIHKKALNAVYDHPFVLVAGLGVPLAATILSEQFKNKHLTFSQKLMQTRVFAQFGVISVLVVTMLFREYMNKHGRFEEPDDDGDYLEVVVKGSDEEFDQKTQIRRK